MENSFSSGGDGGPELVTFKVTQPASSLSLPDL